MCSTLLTENGQRGGLVGGDLCAAHRTEANVRSSGGGRLPQSAFNQPPVFVTGCSGCENRSQAGCRPSQLTFFGRRPSLCSCSLGKAGGSTLAVLGQIYSQGLTHRPSLTCEVVTGNSYRGYPSRSGNDKEPNAFIFETLDKNIRRRGETILNGPMRAPSRRPARQEGARGPGTARLCVQLRVTITNSLCPGLALRNKDAERPCGPWERSR